MEKKITNGVQLLGGAAYTYNLMKTEHPKLKEENAKLKEEVKFLKGVVRNQNKCIKALTIK